MEEVANWPVNGNRTSKCTLSRRRAVEGIVPVYSVFDASSSTLSHGQARPLRYQTRSTVPIGRGGENLLQESVMALNILVSNCNNAREFCQRNKNLEDNDQSLVSCCWRPNHANIFKAAQNFALTNSKQNLFNSSSTYSETSCLFATNWLMFNAFFMRNDNAFGLAFSVKTRTMPAGNDTTISPTNFTWHLQMVYEANTSSDSLHYGNDKERHICDMPSKFIHF